jgi:hypothetical protein
MMYIRIQIRFMKRTLLCILAMLAAELSFAQISYEHTYNGWLYPVLLSSAGEKLYTVDSTAVSIYNTDHTLWRTIPIVPPPGYGFSNAQLISDNLFNLDNSVECIVIFHAFSVGGNKALLISESGSTLFDFNGAYYCNAFYDEVSGKYKVAAVTIHPTGVSYTSDVYALPGSLPCGHCAGSGVPKPKSGSTGQLSPNPTTGQFFVTGAGNGPVYVYNTLGEIVYFTDYYKGGSIDISKYPTGIYTVILNGEAIPLQKL